MQRKFCDESWSFLKQVSVVNLFWYNNFRFLFNNFPFGILLNWLLFFLLPLVKHRIENRGILNFISKYIFYQRLDICYFLEFFFLLLSVNIITRRKYFEKCWLIGKILLIYRIFLHFACSFPCVVGLSCRYTPDRRCSIFLFFAVFGNVSIINSTLITS